MSALKVGTQLGDYRIVEPIGAGGMGEVYLAEHVHLRKLYALKVLPEELAADRQFVARFHDEARVMAELRHPYIVQVHTMGVDKGRYFLAMDFVLGPSGNPESLHDLLKTLPGGRVPPEQVRAWAIQIAEALAYAHERGVVHRDIKPGNILIDAEANVKLTDFGLAKAVGQEFIQSQIHSTMRRTLSGRNTLSGAGQPTMDDTLDAQRTASGSPPSGRGSSGEGILGTYDYMAPEQRGEGGTIDQRTDFYAFGVLLYRLLTGKRPVGLAKSPSQVVKSLPPQWDRITARCLAGDPTERYPTAAALLADLRGVRQASWRRWIITAAAAALVLVVGLVVVGQMPRLHHKVADVPDPTARQPTAAPVTYEQATRAQTDAELAWQRIERLDRGQGFGPLLDEAHRVRANADKFYGDAKAGTAPYATAKAEYDQLLMQCRVLENRQSQRALAAEVRDGGTKAADEARQAGAESDATMSWSTAEAAFAAGGTAFEAGQFADAQGQWMSAAVEYMRALRATEQVATARVSAMDERDRAAQAAVKAAGAESDAVESWMTANAAFIAGGQAFKDGRFAEAQSQWEAAAEAYEWAAQVADRVAAARKLAVEARDKATQAQSAARAANAESNAAEPWNTASVAFAAAGQAFERGQFADAQNQWKVAGEAYAQAKQASEAAAQHKRAVANTYEAGLQQYRTGDWINARKNLNIARDAGYTAGQSEPSPATLLARMDEKEAQYMKEAAAKTVRDAELLKQGVTMLEDARYEEAQTILQEVNPDGLNDADKAMLKQLYSTAEAAVGQRKAARAEFDQAEQLAANKQYAEAAKHYQAVIDNKFADKGTVQKAREGLAIAEAGGKPAEQDVDKIYALGLQQYRKGDWINARKNLTIAREAGYKAGLFEPSPATLLERMDEQEKKFMDERAHQ